jgi:V/A-type H+-transporting ATPase subunit E
MTLEEKLQHFYDRSIEDAKAEADKDLGAYQTQLDQLFEEHKAETLKAADLKVKTEQIGLQREINKELSKKQLDIRHSLAEKQEEIKKEIFVLVRQKLMAMKGTPEYTHWICRKIMISKKVANGEDMTIYIDPSDKDLQQEIEATTSTKVTISDEDFLGGTRVVIPARHILIDDSFKALIQDAKDNFSFEGGVQE